MTDIEYVASRLSREDILCQLAEEAAELAQAALKLRRAITGTNPTPVSEDEALHNLCEEIADVSLAEKVYFEQNKQRRLSATSGLIVNEKACRWVQRLKDKENTNCAAVTPTVAPTDTPTDTPTEGKTQQEKFLEMFPRAALCRGTLDICPEKADIRLHTCENYCDCLDCRKEYWLAVEKEDSHD